MINAVALVGRLTKDIELRKTPSNVSTCSFTLACDRKYKDESGNIPTDFIQCVAWRQSADYLAQYAAKGGIVGVEGSIQTRNYDGQNGKVYVTEVVCSSVKLIGKHKEQQSQQYQGYGAQNNAGGYPQNGYGYNNPPAYNNAPQAQNNGYGAYNNSQPAQNNSQPYGYQTTLSGDGNDLTGYRDQENGLNLQPDDLPFY